MSTTIAHRPHIQIPWTQIAVFMAAAALAAVVLILIAQPWDTGRESGTATQATQAVAADQAVAVQKPASRAQLRAYFAAAAAADEAAKAASTTRHNLVVGTTLDAPSTPTCSSRRRRAAPRQRRQPAPAQLRRGLVALTPGNARGPGPGPRADAPPAAATPPGPRAVPASPDRRLTRDSAPRAVDFDPV